MTIEEHVNSASKDTRTIQKAIEEPFKNRIMDASIPHNTVHVIT